MRMTDMKLFLDKQSWIFAKTYADKAPHEYIVRISTSFWMVGSTGYAGIVKMIRRP